MDELRYFRFDLDTHVFGDKQCRGCSSSPKRCPVPGCNGLLHYEKFVAGDGEGIGTFECCEICRIEDLESIYETQDQTEARWRRRDQWAAPRQTNKTESEVVADRWISEAQRYFEWSKSGDPFAEGPVNPDDPYWQWRGQGPYPHLRSIRPKHDSESLFAADNHFDQFAEFLKRLQVDPKNTAIRAAAVSLYWGLAMLYPRDYGSYTDFDEISGRKREISYSVTDTRDYWMSRRKIFAGYLAHIVRALDLEDCRDSERTRWEIMNAYAAQDLDLARRLFDRASKKRFLPETELIAIRSHFEYLTVFGPDIDRRIGLGPNGSIFSEFRDFREECSVHDPFSLEELNSPVRLLEPSLEGSWELNRNRYFVPFTWALIGASPPTTAEQKHHLHWLTQTLPKVVDSLGSATPYYRSILAQCYEATGQPAEAANQLALIAREITVVGCEVFDHGAFAIRSAHLYRAAGKLEEAFAVLMYATGRESGDARIWAELGRVNT